MQNDRRKIELLSALLLSMPGTPIMYYGDEIGMGDNYYLGDRDGVRTPMQWSADRNAGFSRANPQQLFLPTIQDPVHGYQAVNVEAQQQSPTSLYNWVKRAVAVRQRHSVFGRGEIELLYPRNRKVFAYLRRLGGETMLCVANLSRQAQAAEIDLSEFAGQVPIELNGQSPFPPIGELPYLLTLPAYGFYWFELTDGKDAPSWYVPHTQMLPDFLTLTTRDGTLTAALKDRSAAQFESRTVAEYLPLQRWFAAKGEKIETVALRLKCPFSDGQHMLSVAEVALRGGAVQRYFLPLATEWGEDTLTMGPRMPAILAKLRQANKVGAVVDGAVDEDFANAILAALRDGQTVTSGDDRIEFRGTRGLSAIEEAGEPRLLSAEQSNTSIAFGDQVIVKLYRRLEQGLQPDIEVSRFLTEQTDFDACAALLGTIDWVDEGGTVTTLAAASEFVSNQGDAWTHVTQALDREMERQELGAPDPDPGDGTVLGGPLDLGPVLGRRTAELHLALASGDAQSGFSQEDLTGDDLGSLTDEISGELSAALDRLDGALSGLDGTAHTLARQVLDNRGALEQRLHHLDGMTPSGGRCRIHGDYHLGQVLVAQTDVVIIDFEGEPARSLQERTAKTSPLRDVAGMLRSLDYALWSTVRRRIDLGADPARVLATVKSWRQGTQGAFLDAYRETMGGAALHPNDPAFEKALLDLFLIQKAAYELSYEMAMRPDWIEIPLRGLLSLIDEETGESH
jgi:maltose alpha-D-glucosyltransferase/alpha-amylase